MWFSKKGRRETVSAPITIRTAFNSDPKIVEEVERRIRESAPATNGTNGRPESVAKAKNRLLKELFEKASLCPGALDKYAVLVEKDIERYAKELKNFKEVVQRNFDEDNGLLPTPSRGLSHSLDGDGVQTMIDGTIVDIDSGH